MFKQGKAQLLMQKQKGWPLELSCPMGTVTVPGCGWPAGEGCVGRMGGREVQRGCGGSSDHSPVGTG